MRTNRAADASGSEPMSASALATDNGEQRTENSADKRFGHGQSMVIRNRWVSLRLHRRSVLVTGVLTAAALLLGVLSLGIGDYWIPPVDVLRSLFGAGTATTDLLILDLRLPRVATALLVGAALAISGAIVQTLTRNPLGSPDVIGLQHGAGSGALLTLLVFGGGIAVVPFGAIAGQLACGAVIYLLSFRQGLRGPRFILIGVAMGAMLNAFNIYLIASADLYDASQAAIWLVGSLSGRSWAEALPVAIALVVLAPAMMAMAPRLRLLELGDDSAAGLGVRVEHTRLALLGVAIVLSSLAIAATGPVLFVALMAPQVVRRLTRSPAPGLASSAAFGAFMMLASDLVARHLLSPHQLPVGVVTGAVGGAYLLFLLASRNRKER